MSKRGFTLAELLGVIVILGILGMVAMLAIEKNIRDGRLKTCKTQEKTIIEGAKMWQIDNPTSEGSVTIEQLKNGGYIDEKLINPMTEEKYNEYTRVNINTNEYTVEYISEKGCS